MRWRGRLARANDVGSVVISGNSYQDPSDYVEPGGPEQMVLRADGGIYVTDEPGTAPYETTRLINTSTGAYLSQSGQWVDVSDRNLKENFEALDGAEVLRGIAVLPVTRWNYKTDPDDVMHIGPVSQDVYGIFGVGYDDKTISALDLAGISVAGVQELYRTILNQAAEIGELRSELRELRMLTRSLVEARAKE